MLNNSKKNKQISELLRLQKTVFADTSSSRGGIILNDYAILYLKSTTHPSMDKKLF